MTILTNTKLTFEDGREAQYQEMMQGLAKLQGKYKGVRGELLAKVSEELAKLKPAGGPSAPVSAAPCRVCGRDMKASATAGELVCMNGHKRIAT